MKQEDMLVLTRIPNCKNEEEYVWVNKVGMKSYRPFIRYFVNPIFTRVYNWVWTRIDKPVDGEYYPDKHPNYERVYFGILNQLIKPVIFCMGGYNFKTKRKITINLDYEMVPIEHETATHEFVNFLNVEDFGR